MTLLLALAMITNVVTQGAAQASSRHGVVHELVICSTDGGESVILVDAEGNRVDPDDPCLQMHCSDCLASAVQALIEGPATGHLRVRTSESAQLAPFPFAMQRRPGQQTARGPPLKV